MAGRFVRSSKYRHIFGRPTKKEQCYDNLRISSNAWDTNLVKVNPKYISVNWEAAGGGALAVVPLHERGKLPDQIPLFRGHTAAVLDTDWNPFDDSFLASGADDGKVLLWKVPTDFSLHQEPDVIKDVAPVAKLAGHTRKIGHVLFNPAAANVLASSSGDHTIKAWDVTSESAKYTLKHNDIVQSLSWSANGALLVTTCRDKKLRIWDVRQEAPAIETPGHSGAKNSRAVWMGENDRIATTGFSKMSDRQLGLWDVRAAREPLNGFELLDQISGVCMPFWDDGTQCLYLAGRGDGNIRYYEYVHDKFEYLSQHSSVEPQRGIAFLPKRGIDTHDNEIMRAYRTVHDQYIEPVSFIVPRRSEIFQSDIYPPTVGLIPGADAKEWLSGKTTLPPKMSLESIYDGEEPTPLPSNQTRIEALDDKAVANSATLQLSESAAVTAQPPNKPASPINNISTVTDRLASTNSESQHAIAKAASKFADEEAEDDTADNNALAFEELSKPVIRPLVNSKSSPVAIESTTRSNSENIKTQIPGLDTEQASSLPASMEQGTAVAAWTKTGTSTEDPASTVDLSSIYTQLQDIKQMLVGHNTIIAAQNDKLAALAREVASLKGQSS